MAHGIRAHWPTARNCPVFPVYVLALPRPALEKTLRGPTSVYGRRGDPGEGLSCYCLCTGIPTGGTASAPQLLFVVPRFETEYVARFIDGEAFAWAVVEDVEDFVATGQWLS